MIKCSPEGTRETFLKRVNPGMPIPAVVTRLTGIADQAVKDSPPFKDIAGDVLRFIRDADFGGFNIERFDLPVLEREIFEAGLLLDWRTRKIYDAQKLYHFYEKRDLKAAYKFYCRKDLLNAHTALGDTEAALEILEAQVKTYGTDPHKLESLLGPEFEPPGDFFDKQKRFRWWNGALYPVFGKYGRKYSVQEIVSKDPGYLRYLAGSDFDEKIKGMLRDCLKGEFPSRDDHRED
jgi:DNA polymerase-3 subunit epsilon